MTRLKLVAIAMAMAVAVALPFAGAAEDAPGVFKIPGTDSTIKFNGFAEMVYVYEFTGQTDLANAGEIYANPPLILLDNDPARKQSPNSLGFEVFYSRFGFATNTPSRAGAIGVRIEGDFNHNIQLQGTSFTHKGDLRVRHAYGTVGDWLLLGQTWTTFADLGTFPDQQDENPIFNLAALRAPMVRLSLPAGPVKVTVAAEDPYVNSIGKANSKYEIPDFIARVDIPTPMAGLSVRGVTKQFKTKEPGSVSAQAFGGAVGAAVKIGGDTLVLDGEAGSGLGAYHLATVAGLVPEDAVVTATDVKLFTSYGGSVGYTHVWSPQFRSNIAGSGVWIKDDAEVRAAAAASSAIGAATYASANQRVLSGLVNTYWTFAKNAWVGAEFWYNYRKTFGGDLGHETRILLTSHFDFL